MKKKLLVFISVFFLLIAGAAKATIYVTPNGGSAPQDGSSWTKAAPGIQLQTLINNAAAATQIWVSKGTYIPTINPVSGSIDNRELTFVLKNGVILYGGFAGTETLLSQRIIATNPTILSGDLGVVGDVTDNAYHVVVSVNNNSSTILDGFDIKNGNANGGTFSVISGVGIYQYQGGGMYNSGSSPIINNCTFKNNLNNGIYNASFSNPTITNSIFIGNSTLLDGGAILNSFSSPGISNCIFSNNTATRYGGGMFNDNASPDINNSIFIGNSASFGGGVYSISNPGITIYSSTFTNNTAGANQGGAMYISGSTFTIQNSIIYGNTSGIVGSSNTNSSAVNYSLVQGGYVGTGNIATNPLFVNSANPAGNDGLYATSDDGLYLQQTSPAVDAGDNTPIAPNSKDIAGNARIFNSQNGGIVDMGAYESSFTPLPLKLISFNGKVVGNQTQLNWKTASEENTSHFNVEYGTGETFSTIDSITAAGNSTAIRYYSFIHQTPKNGSNYYRLKMMDNDAKFTYSDIIQVKISLKQSNIVLYPNPAREDVWVQHPSSTNSAQLKLVDMAGKIFKTTSVEKDVLQTKVDLNGLKTGIYNVIWTDGIDTQSQFLVIE